MQTASSLMESGKSTLPAASFFQPSADIESTRGPKIVEMLRKVAEVDFLRNASEVEALLQEARLIKEIPPPDNSDLTDDKSFPFLKSRSALIIPRVHHAQPSERAIFSALFAGVSDLRSTLVILQKIFKFRT
jgi:excinuclease UvrABC nuclease subunit